MKDFSTEVLLQIFSYLTKSDWKSIRSLSKAWSVTAAKHVFNEICLDPSDRAISSLTALSNHKYLREIPSRLRVDAKLVEPNLSIHEFVQHLLQQIRLCSQCWGWPPHSKAVLPGFESIAILARRPLPLISELLWCERELCIDSAMRSRYKAYLQFVNQQQRWRVSRQKNLLRNILPRLPNIQYLIFSTTWLTSETFNKWPTGEDFLYLGLDPVHQAPVGNHLSELMHAFGGYTQRIKSLTIEINGQLTIANRSRDILQGMESLTLRLGPCFRAEDAAPLIDIIRYMTRLQTLDVQFSSCKGAGDTSFWALQELLEMLSCTSGRLSRLFLTRAVVLLDDLGDFVRSQPMLQEIVLSDSVIIPKGQGDQQLLTIPAQLHMNREART